MRRIVYVFSGYSTGAANQLSTKRKSMVRAGLKPRTLSTTQAQRTRSVYSNIFVSPYYTGRSVNSRVYKTRKQYYFLCRAFCLLLRISNSYFAIYNVRPDRILLKALQYSVLLLYLSDKAKLVVFFP